MTPRIASPHRRRANHIHLRRRRQPVDWDRAGPNTYNSNNLITNTGYAFDADGQATTTPTLAASSNSALQITTMAPTGLGATTETRVFLCRSMPTSLPSGEMTALGATTQWPAQPHLVDRPRHRCDRRRHARPPAVGGLCGRRFRRPAPNRASRGRGPAMRNSCHLFIALLVLDRQ
jgi:hypothetical protein